MLPPSAAGANAFSAKRGTTMPPNIGDDQSEVFSRGSTLKMASVDDSEILQKRCENRCEKHCETELDKQCVSFCLGIFIIVAFLAFIGVVAGGFVCLLSHTHLVNQITAWADEGRIATVSTSVVPDGLGKRQVYSYGHHPTLNATVSQASSFGSMVSVTAPISSGVSTVSEIPAATSAPAPASVTDQLNTTITTSVMSVVQSTDTSIVTETDTVTVSFSAVGSTSETDVTVVNTATVIPVPRPVSMNTTGTTATAGAVTGGSSTWSSNASGWNLTCSSSWSPTAGNPAAGTSGMTKTITVQPSSPIHTESVGFSTFSIDAATTSMSRNSSASSEVALSTSISTVTVLYNSTALTKSVTSSASSTGIATSQPISSKRDTETETESFYTTRTETLQSIDTIRVTATVSVQSPAVSTSGAPVTETTLTGTVMTSTETLASTMSNFTTRTSTQTVVVSLTADNCSPPPTSFITVTATVVQTHTAPPSANGYTAKAVSSPMNITQETSTVTSSMGQSHSVTGIPSISISPNTTVTVGSGSGGQMSTSTSCNGTTATTHIYTTAFSNDAVTNPAPSSYTAMFRTTSDPKITSSLTVSMQTMATSALTSSVQTVNTTGTGMGSLGTGSFGTGSPYGNSTNSTKTCSLTSFHGTGTGTGISVVTISSTVYANYSGAPPLTTGPAISSSGKNFPARIFADTTPGSQSGSGVPSGHTSCVVMFMTAILLCLEMA